MRDIYMYTLTYVHLVNVNTTYIIGIHQGMFTCGMTAVFTEY